MFLTRSQVRELTGAATRARQIDVLKRNGVPFIVNASGWPVVTVAAVEGRRETPAPQGWVPRILAA
jgi:hypothetical protein